ncbi:hypothetical protein DL96DRAFT_1713050 [Flagelloscypha sp. PMI_526]|nr:hypothetical protein DL96DRAFT_1713050 [Flagelloscypha sp. PMI_526]
MSKKKLDPDTVFTTTLHQLTPCKTALKSNSLIEVEELATLLAKLGDKFTIFRTYAHVGETSKDRGLFGTRYQR